jgi:predicted Fe-Mo cluster-binding NifX family protein
MKTIVAVALQNKKTVFEHAEKCRNFLMFAIDDNVVVDKYLLELSKEETLYNLLHKEISKNNFASSLFDIDILLARDIGEDAIQKLALENISCFRIEETDPDTAIKELINGTLEAMSPISLDKSGCNCNCGTEHRHH